MHKPQIKFTRSQIERSLLSQLRTI